MGRLRRILFAALAGVSLLLCVAAAGAWGRSYFVFDTFAHRAGDRLWTIRVGGGLLAIARLDLTPFPSGLLADGAWRHEGVPPEALVYEPSNVSADRWAFDAGGVRYATRTIDSRTATRRPGLSETDRYDARLLVIPLAYVTILSALAPAAWLVGFVKRRRRAARERVGLCRHTGYDLRASPGRCPECGGVPTSRGDIASEPGDAGG